MGNPIPPAVYGTNAESCQCLLGHVARAALGVSQMFRLLLLDNGWADCVEIWYAIESHLVVVHALVAVSTQWSRLGYLCTCARAHRASVSQERLGRLCSNLVCGLGVINYVLSTSHWLGSSARAHVHTPSPYLRSRLTDCANIWFVAREPIVTKLTTISKENHSLIHYERGRRPSEFSLNMRIFSSWATDRPTVTLFSVLYLLNQATD